MQPIIKQKRDYFELLQLIYDQNVKTELLQIIAWCYSVLCTAESWSVTANVYWSCLESSKDLIVVCQDFASRIDRVQVGYVVSWKEDTIQVMYICWILVYLWVWCFYRIKLSYCVIMPYRLRCSLCTYVRTTVPGIINPTYPLISSVNLNDKWLSNLFLVFGFRVHGSTPG